MCNVSYKIKNIKNFQLKIILLTVVIHLTACGSAVKQEEHWVWPLPPEQPRLKYIKSIRSSKDVKPETASDTFKQLVGGMPQDVALVKPYGVAAFNDIIYVTDTILGRLLVFKQNEKDFKVFGGKGSGRLSKPIDVAVDQQGMVYVTDASQSRVIVYDKDGKYLRAMGGPEVLARPTGVTVNPLNGNVYVVNTGTLESKNHSVSVFDAKGRHMYDIGTRGSETGEFNFPTNICSDSSGKIYIADTGNFRVQIFDSGGTYLDSFGTAGTGLGSFARPKGIAVDSEGHIYVIDAAFNNIQIFDQDKKLLLFAGSMGKGPGQFWLPAGMWIDAKDRIYVADQYNHRVQVWQYMGRNFQQSKTEPKL